jgi:hypothetical protein
MKKKITFLFLTCLILALSCDSSPVIPTPFPTEPPGELVKRTLFADLDSEQAVNMVIGLWRSTADSSLLFRFDRNGDDILYDGEVCTITKGNSCYEFSGLGVMKAFYTDNPDYVGLPSYFDTLTYSTDNSEIRQAVRYRPFVYDSVPKHIDTGVTLKQPISYVHPDWGGFVYPQNPPHYNSSISACGLTDLARNTCVGQLTDSASFGGLTYNGSIWLVKDETGKDIFVTRMALLGGSGNFVCFDCEGNISTMGYNDPLLNQLDITYFSNLIYSNFNLYDVL